ncbi:methyltransferase domain-containing protein [Geobacter sp.]|uniref:methyltransferase domain-containing protein n=1 Tax=Geobacter sp. TaxID=46610 RepID=UPI00262DDC38|nr:methyltransferase domain-containing protein [Geobacter sp.]
MLTRLKQMIKDSGLIPSYRARRQLAARYLRGTGLEIGALHFPLQVPAGVDVKYVDYATREENIRRFPELDGEKIVFTDFVEDGFTLHSLDGASQDFLVANHVLEHANNPIQVLVNWSRILRRDGVLFVSVPIGARCFDRGREVTTLRHLIEDFELVARGDLGEFARRNRRHYEEWVRISMRNVHKLRASEAELMEMIEKMSDESTEIHYHVFSRDSFGELLEYFTLVVDTSLTCECLVKSRGGAEYVAILRKRI